MTSPPDADIEPGIRKGNFCHPKPPSRQDSNDAFANVAASVPGVPFRETPPYDGPMKRLFIVLVVLAATLVSTGCKSDPGSREYSPGKGWRPV